MQCEVFCERADPSYSDMLGQRLVREFPAAEGSRKLSQRWGVALSNQALIRAVEAFHPAAIVVDGLSSAGTAIALTARRRRHRARMIWWSLGMVPNRRKGVRSLTGDMVQRWATRRCAGVIAYGSHAKSYFEALAPGTPIVISQNTIDETTVPVDGRSENRRRIRQTLALGDGPVLMFCGRLEPAKRVNVLLDAMKLLSGELHPKPKLLVVGDGRLMPQLRAQAVSLGIDDDVVFAGRVVDSSVSGLFFASDLVVLPGAGGLAINHAFAHGRPVVCGPADGTERDLVLAGQTGMLLEEATDRRIADAVKLLVSDQAHCATLGANAERLVRTSFSLERGAHLFETALSNWVRQDS